MKKPKTRIGYLQRALRTVGVSEARLAKLAGCSLPYIKKLKRKKTAQLGGAIAIRLANETGVDLQWLRGKYRPDRVRGRFGTQWTPAVYRAIQAAKLSPQRIATEKDLLTWYWLVNIDRLGAILAAGLRKKQSTLALDRVHVALAQVAAEFGVSHTEQAALDRTAGILMRHRKGKPLAETAKTVARRFARALNAAAKSRPTV